MEQEGILGGMVCKSRGGGSLPPIFAILGRTKSKSTAANIIKKPLSAKQTTLRRRRRGLDLVYPNRRNQSWQLAARDNRIKIKVPFLYFSLIECGVHPFKLRFFQARVSETLSTGLGALFILFVHQMTALGMSLWWGKLQTSPAIAINYKSLAGLVGKCG